MLSSQSKELKHKYNRKYTKESKATNKIPIIHSNKSSKKSLKSTPHHSKQKSDHDIQTKGAKDVAARFDYYNTHNTNKSKPNRIKNESEQDIHKKNKKYRRNNPQLSKNAQKTQNQLYQSTALNDYHQPIQNQEQQLMGSQSQKINNPILKKIKILSSQGSIDFNGQIVRKRRVDSQREYKNIFPQHASQHYYSPLGFQKNTKKSTKSRNKSRSDSKKQKVSSKSKKKQKMSSQQSINTKNMSDTGTPKCRQSRRSGHQFNYRNTPSERQRQSAIILESYRGPYLLPNQQQLQELHQQIQQDSENVSEYILSQELIKERGQCLNMLGKICSSMNLKRQTYSIAMCYIDSFIDINTEIKYVKTIAIASLMMALKIDHAEMVGAGGQFSTLSSLQSFTLTKGMSMSTQARSQEKRSSGKKQSRGATQQQIPSQSKQPKFNLNRPKLPNVLTTVLSHQQIFSQYDRILCKQQIMDMEMQMMVKLNFKLTIKSCTFWVETLTNLWDIFVMRNHTKLKNKILFRMPQMFKNLSYLFQLLEISYYFPYAYFYPKAILVLSVMYLLVRIRIQFPIDREDRGFEHYKNNLGKSTNIIFIDKMGSNELFGEFLALLELDLGDIVNCCQYVSHYLNFKILRVFSFDPNRSMTHEQHVCIYHYNPQIYRLFQLKCSNYADRNQM